MEASIIYTLEPVLGAAFAYLLLGERWGPAGWCGAALIVLSSLATQIWGSPAAPLSEELVADAAAAAAGASTKAAASASQAAQEVSSKLLPNGSDGTDKQ